MEVALAKYPEIEHVSVDVKITIAACVVEELSEPNGIAISPINTITELPVKLEINMPKFTPKPLCEFSTTDVAYELTTDSGDAVPGWLSMDLNRQKIVAEIGEDNSTLFGKELKFKLRAAFQKKFEQVQTFRIVFPKKSVQQ